VQESAELQKRVTRLEQDLSSSAARMQRMQNRHALEVRELADARQALELSARSAESTLAARSARGETDAARAAQLQARPCEISSHKP
jgi:uncharacterized protein YoxC